MDYVFVGYLETKDDWFYEKSKFLCMSWWENSFLSQKGDHFMAWHDHAIAIRLQQFLKLLFFAHEKKDSECLSFLYKAIYIHTRILDEDETIRFYKHNHGLEQASSLYLSSIIAPSNSSLYKELLRERSSSWLRDECEHLLTKEGIQTENSPSYHGVICSDIYRLDQLISSADGTKPFYSEKIQNNSLKFLTCIAQPNGCLAPLGDTHSDLKPNAASFWNFKKLSEFPFYEYVITLGKKGQKPTHLEAYWPKSGYYVLRDKWDDPGENKACQLIVKCGFEAVGHRHDDDAHFLLYGFGEPWLIDAGWYSYTHDENRSYVLSPEGHNISSPTDFKIRKESENLTLPSIKPKLSLKGKKLTCKTRMYKGYLYKRRFSIKSSRHFSLVDIFQIKDFGTRLSHFLKQRKYVLRFMFPPDKKIFIKEDRVIIKSHKTSAFLRILFFEKPFKS